MWYEVWICKLDVKHTGIVNHFQTPQCSAAEKLRRAIWPSRKPCHWGSRAWNRTLSPPS